MNDLPVAVVGRGPHSDKLIIEHPLVALCDQLMRAADELYSVGVVEIGADVAPKQVAGTPWTEPPALYVLWVRPEQVTHSAIMRHFLLPVYCPDLRQAHATSAQQMQSPCIYTPFVLHKLGEPGISKKLPTAHL